VTLRVFLSRGFRPFFLGAALWAVIAIGLWVAMLTTGFALPIRFAPLMWHIHEMLFGFVLAAVAGFLLTAIQEWTGRRPVSGNLLGLLCGLWLLGRVDALCSGLPPLWLAMAADIAFPVALVAIVAREIVAGGGRRLMIVPVCALTLAQLLMDLGGEADIGDLGAYGWRLGCSRCATHHTCFGRAAMPSECPKSAQGTAWRPSADSHPSECPKTR
jgi:uncharacterized protein involved in response to NO